VPARFRLEAARCAGCEKIVYPRRRICPACRGSDWEPLKLSRHAKVLTSTVVHVAPDDLGMEAPYAVAVIETDEGVRLMAQVADCDPAEVAPGLEVSLEFRRIRREGHSGILCYGFKAVPSQ